MVILGIDPGFGITGYGVIKVEKEKIEILTYGCIKTLTKDPFPKRLKEVYQGLKNIIQKYTPDQVAIEKLYFARNVTTAMKVGEARGVAILVAALAETPIKEYTPLQVKQTLTGYGRAQKSQIQQMVKMLLKMDKIPRPDDAADALAIAITCSRYHKFNQLVKSKN